MLSVDFLRQNPNQSTICIVVVNFISSFWEYVVGGDQTIDFCQPYTRESNIDTSACYCIYKVGLSIIYHSFIATFNIFFLKIFVTLFYRNRTASLTYKRLIWLLKNTEAVAQRHSVKKLLLEISQNSQEITCVRASFLIKLQGTGFFLRILRNF